MCGIRTWQPGGGSNSLPSRRTNAEMCTRGARRKLKLRSGPQRGKRTETAGMHKVLHKGRNNAWHSFRNMQHIREPSPPYHSGHKTSQCKAPNLEKQVHATLNGPYPAMLRRHPPCIPDLARHQARGWDGWEGPNGHALVQATKGSSQIV